jgi:7-keto-8-aminopelargonate synthetase-like enzyme
MRTELAVTGRTRRCLNLGSYNYLGFAAADEYCTPRVLDTLAEWGMSTCSARTEGGAYARARAQDRNHSAAARTATHIAALRVPLRPNNFRACWPLLRLVWTVV